MSRKGDLWTPAAIVPAKELDRATTTAIEHLPNPASARADQGVDLLNCPALAANGGLGFAREVGGPAGRKEATSSKGKAKMGELDVEALLRKLHLSDAEKDGWF